MNNNRIGYIVKEDINTNFNVSIIIPFFKKMKEFRVVFPLNRKYFERNGIELIFVLDCPNEKDELVSYIKQYPLLNCRILMNDHPHEWRNPAKPLNVGIRNATKKYIMVCSPESEFFTDAIYILRRYLKYYPGHYAIGRVYFAEHDEILDKENLNNYKFIPFGSIMVERKYLLDIKGYDELFDKWGGDDNNIRSRLEMHGICKLYIPEVMLIHRDIQNDEGKKRRNVRVKDINNERYRIFFYPKSAITNDCHWGTDFNKIIYDYADNIFAKELLENYLNSYSKYKFCVDDFSKKYRILLLVQSYNESEFIVKFLEDMSTKFDGIILLDDGSEDDTFELANHDKLLLKVKKKRGMFNDFLNRNILLDLASFFKHEWVCFIDVDESFDDRFCDIQSLPERYKDADSFIFNLVQLWNDDNYYNADYPSTMNGLSVKFRMFKNIGRSQIQFAGKKLHFIPVSHIGRTYHVPILIKHFGNINEERRKNKYNFYKKQDRNKDQLCYKHLLENEARVLALNMLTENMMSDSIKILK